MSVNDSVSGNVTKPEVKRHDRVFQIPFKSAIRFDQDVLDNIADPDPAANFLVQADSDQLLQGVSVPLQQVIYG